VTQPWVAHVIDPEIVGGAHDLVFADIDGDGRRELLANAIGPGAKGLFIYVPGGDLTEPWKRFTVQDQVFQEGLAVGDLDGDGRLEIVHGPDAYFPPDGGPLAGKWKRTVVAKGFREMCRVCLVDVTGNGRPDIVMAESEFFDGRMSWFENRLVEEPRVGWIEHPLDSGLVYAHSMDARRDADSGQVSIFVAEMAEGGWAAPRNFDARLIEYSSDDNGKSWQRDLLCLGTGTHQAIRVDLDGDGRDQIAGKEWTKPKVQIWRKVDKPSPLLQFRHQFIDRDKPGRSTDIVPVDVDGDGLADVCCGPWWYHNPTWQRRTIPGVAQVINACDIDGDGRQELIATAGQGLTNELLWLKPIDPLNDKWETHAIGTGAGDWPHGSAIAPLLPGGKLALVVGHHSAHSGHFPELFEVPDDPAAGPWPRRVLAEVQYGEEIVAADLTGNGRLDLVLGNQWLENLGDGTFRRHVLCEDFQAARAVVADLAGNGRPDIILGEEKLDFANKVTPFSRLAWLGNPGHGASGPWPVRVIDTMRCPHSIGAGDLDGDGQMEIVAGEHHPFRPYRSRCRLYVYKMIEPGGRRWNRFELDDRFEHHDGCKVFQIAPGKLGIISHGWTETRYVHLWTVS